MLTIYNKGIGGQNSQEGRDRFNRDVLGLKPDFVFIYFGLNDALNEEKFVSEDHYIANLTWMIHQACKANIKPILCNIHPVGEHALYTRHDKCVYGKEGPNGKIQRYNRALEVLINKENVPLANFAAVVSALAYQGEALVSQDGVHLTPAGYQALALCFYEVVDEFPEPCRIVCFGDSVTWGAGVVGSGTIHGETYPSYLQKYFLNDNIRTTE